MMELPWRPPAGKSMCASLSPDLACVVAIGVFDGVHLGHRALLAAAKEDARKRGVDCVVVTFDPDPAEVVQAKPRQAQRLCTTQDRVALLRAAGADEVVVLAFTQEFACLSPEEFVTRGICSHMRPLAMHVGSNFRFGYRGVGTPDLLAKLGERLGFFVHAHDLFEAEGDVVSATRIRELLAQGGCLDEANRLLGHCHFVRGAVVHGRGEGASFGFPTANVVFDMRDCLPAEGVYAGYIIHGEDAWPAAINVGAPPTFSEAKPAFLEANVIGFTGNLYGEEVTVSFVYWLRPSRVFDSLAELEDVVLDNIAWVRDHLS